MTRPAPPEPASRSSIGSALWPVASRASLVSCGVAVIAALGWLTVILAAPAAFECAAMSAAACPAGSTSLLAALLVAAAGARAGWLGLAAARGVAALPQLAIPPALARAAHRGDVTRVCCVDSTEQVAFCAGLRRPRIYVSSGMVAGLADDELAAVLAHENAHARHRDPLRGLLTRACADVAFFAPLLRWWQHRRHLHAELAADRAAVEHAGAAALAGALLRLAGPPGEPAAGAPAFGPTGAVLETRIAALTSTTTAPRRPLPTRAGVASVAGVLGAVVIVACLPPLVVMLG